MQIRLARDADQDAVWHILQPTIRAGDTYALPRDMSEADAIAYWMGADRETFVAEETGSILGTYYLRPNQLGGGAHVANCGYVTIPEATGRGVARPIMVGDPCGTLTVEGNYTQTATGVLLIQIAAHHQCGQLAMTGTATLAGTLQVSLLGDDVPAVGTNFQIMTFAEHTGGFTTEVGLALPNHDFLKPVWGSNDLTLTVSDSAAITAPEIDTPAAA
jgi:hypothetical protein